MRFPSEVVIYTSSSILGKSVFCFDDKIPSGIVTGTHWVLMVSYTQSLLSFGADGMAGSVRSIRKIGRQPLR